MQIRLPNNSERLVITGRTGSGKTFAELWHVSQRPIDKMPYVLYDFKYDDTINKIEGMEEVGLDFVPSKKHTGLFIVHPIPELEDDRVQRQMWKLWERENVGVIVDEGYMIAPSNNAFKALLTQGRSKKIPMIILSQRPAWLSRFVFSEASFYQIFDLNDIRDKQTVSNFVPIGYRWRLQEFHSYYYHVSKNTVVHLSPVPDEGELLQAISDKIKPKKNRFV